MKKQWWKNFTGLAIHMTESSGKIILNAEIPEISALKLTVCAEDPIHHCLFGKVSFTKNTPPGKQTSLPAQWGVII